MTDHKKSEQNESGTGVGTVIAAVTGVVVGAGVAVAGAVALSDKKNREKIKHVFTDVKNQAVGYIDGLQKKTQNEKGKVKKIVKIVNKAKKEIKSV